MFRMTLKIALASLGRRRTRTILVILMISVSLWGLLFMEGIYDGMMEQMISNAIRSDSGHITLQAKGYRLEKDIKKLIVAPEEVEKPLGSDPRVRSLVKRLEHEGLVATAHYSRGVRIIGIDPHAEQNHGRLHEYLKQGEFGFGEKGRGAILGATLAEKLKVGIGKKIILSAQATDNEIASVALKVSGIIRTNNMAFDEMAVFIDLDRATDFFRVDHGVTRISVLVHDPETTESLQADLRPHFPELEVFRWDELYPALLQSRVMMEWFNMITSMLVFSAASIGIVGVMLVSVLERIREFGIMSAIGTEFRQIAGIVLLESLLIGLCGYVAGIIPGWLTLYYFQQKGLDLSQFSQAFEAFGMDAITYALIRPEYFITALFAVMAASVISVLFPLRVLRKAKPIESIQGI